MMRFGRLLGLFMVSSTPVWSAETDTPSTSAPRWEVFADCATAYLANWQNRLTDRSRAPAMSAMIQEEAEQYKLAAIGFYAEDKKAPKDEAGRNVDGHMKSALTRFIAMDKAGTLEAYIDKCPQVEGPN